ncbi:four helix bundle protein [Candidatus Shapirobacteria bacterium]|nr:four helix bundle protein [Candidatus Shapirobacteria bacterium]
MKFIDLKIWEKSHKLTIEIYKLCKKLPNTETFGIISQIQRSSSSIPANIAEGFGRKGKKEFIQFLYQAKGSLTETEYFLILIKDLNYVDNIGIEKLIFEYEILAKMLNSFITQLKAKNV